MKDSLYFAAQTQKLFIEVPLLVNTYDIDAAGHVNNIVYIRWLEDLRTKLFSKICNYKGIIDSGYYLVVIFTEIKYRKQLKIFDNPIGLMEFINHQHGIITLKSVIKLKNEISAAAIQKCILLDLNTNKIMPDKMIGQNLFNSGLNA